MAKRILFGAALAVLISVSSSATKWVVSKVISGESFLSVKEVVHLKGVNAPPGEKARVHFEELLNAGIAEVSGNDDHNSKGHVWVYLKGAPGFDIGAQMIRDGYAQADRSAPYEKQGEYIIYEIEARCYGRGLWTDSPPMTSNDEIFRENSMKMSMPDGAITLSPPVITDVDVPVYAHDFVYHRSGCWLINEDSQVKSVGFAVAEAFAPCTRCSAPMLDTTAVDMNQVRHMWAQGN